MKTALGRAILHSPQTCSSTMPTNGLDVPTIRSLRALLRRLRDLGQCILFSSHVLDEVRALCDKVVVISNGRLAAEGSPSEPSAPKPAHRRSRRRSSHSHAEPIDRRSPQRNCGPVCAIPEP